MARTLIGQLILRLRAEGLSEASKIQNRMGDIERAARRLAAMPTGNWGLRFQKQLDALRLAPQEIDAVNRSWRRLADDMKRRNINTALRSQEVSHWKSQTIASFAAAKSEHAAMVAAIERQSKAHAGRMRAIMRPAMVAGGFYTGAYGLGLAGRNALTAASESTRTKYRMELANIQPEERQAMEGEAQRLSGKYPTISEADILELNRASFALFGGNGDRARAMMEPIIRSFIADVTAVGVEKAGENLSAFLKAMDNLNVNEGPDGGVGNIGGILEGWVKAKQVEGKEVDVGDILGFARRAKVAKYALSDEFLSDYLPALGQDTGFDALGDALAGAYQNFVTPVYTGKQAVYSKRQAAIGLRDENNSLVERDLFASNPYKWTQDVLRPILAESGVDMQNTAAVSEAVKKLMSNSKAAAIITGWLEAQTQIEKNVAMYRKAVGTGDVDNAISKDPFAAWGAVKSSLENLSAALLPAETVADRLRTVADGINALAAAGKGSPLATTLGIGGAAAGLYFGGKFAANKMSDMFGLRTSALALDGSAAALTRAAVALGGAGVAADMAPGKAGKTGAPPGKGTGPLALLPHAMIYGAGKAAIESGFRATGKEPVELPSTFDNARALVNRILSVLPEAPEPTEHTPIVAPAREAEDASMRQLRVSRSEEGPVGEREMAQQGIAAANAPNAPEAPKASAAPNAPEAPEAPKAPAAPNAPEAPEAPKAPAAPRAAIESPAREAENKSMVELKVAQGDGSLDEAFLASARQKAAETGREIEAALNVTARPNVDSSAIDVLLAKIRTAKRELLNLGASVEAAERSVSAEMRRNFADAY